MAARFSLAAASPGGYQAMLALHAHVRTNGLDPALIELVKLRVSQLNGCAYCIALHVDKARKAGVSEARMHLLATWREAPLYSEPERAALQWAEALTLLCNANAADVAGAAYAAVGAHFSTEQIAELSVAVAEINAWNRLMIAARTPPDVEALT